MSISIHPPRRRIAPRGVPAVILALALGLPGSTPHAGELQPELYFSNGGRLFKVDYSGLLAEYTSTATRTGSFTIRLSRAVFAGDHGVAADERFLLSADPRPDDLDVLGTRQDEALRLTGRRARDLDGWAEWLTYTLETTPEEWRVTCSAGPDRLTLTTPRSASTDRADAELRIAVNGIEVSADLARSLAGAAGATPAPPPFDSGAFHHGAGFVDFPIFANRVEGLALVHGTRLAAGERLPLIDAPNGSGNCFPSCMACAGAILNNIATSMALISACGAAVASAGGLTPVCIAAFLAHQGANFVFVSACVACGLCVEPDPPDCPCKGEPNCNCA